VWVSIYAPCERSATHNFYYVLKVEKIPPVFFQTSIFTAEAVKIDDFLRFV
jgi:hypothetical protein